MAEYLASIFGTEKDKVNCSFYFKIGACRHGERCSRVHNKPTFSQTILLKNLYLNPNNNSIPKPEGGFEQFSGNTFTDEEVQQHFDEFYEEVYTEVEDKYGEIEAMTVCDNLGEHLVGNIYIKFRYERDAERAVEDLNTRWFDRKPIYAELSPVTDFKEASCRQYELGECMRSGFCNFMHIKTISQDVKKRLRGRRKRSRSHSHSPSRKNRRH
ncbi:unnamed protein product [Rotaria sordida]|uniref:Splicing factor U2AF 35 kDa subunit n=1 Tax=Rotaria sordida TaxID=392033 RepID=A0A818WYK6_9BILA|nr:unnamed protein product [Rotaria sordida]CAF1139815.1 unnamed protein product [Rotaria sordida]CAF1162092.1 unnamed protein product [Rotaria sordida]CAF1181324.1 unnamed protein product [Rotaria sordida]CAF1442350.1 unnamed protein product [Rotaria sordida]